MWRCLAAARLSADWPSGNAPTTRAPPDLTQDAARAGCWCEIAANAPPGLGKIADEHGRVSADRARPALSSFFAWGIGEGLCDINPVIGTNKHFDGAKSRDRVLADRELAIIWHALPDSDYGKIVKLLILTGQRREEIGALRRTEVDLEELVITLPPERTKNGPRTRCRCPNPL
jgi:integrase